ncbi:MAG: PEP-CTERM sorting domain-containing protein [Deltaproteobacteria bacterium]|nr:PEP-CTERM sorting domain-containing protein [Deltaproteobacteria bacterium]
MSIRSRFAGAATFAGLLFAAALPANAAPIQMWLQPNGGFGFDAASSGAASGAGIEFLVDSTFFSNPSPGSPRVTITTPSPIPGHSVQGATKANPSTGDSTWTVRAVDRAYQDLWIVIQGHDPNDSNASHYNDNSRIGLVIDPTDPNWALVHPTGFPNVTYLAYYVGDLAQGASFDVPISYAVAMALKVVQTNPLLCVFPQYRVNFLELAQVPEPAVISLLAFSGTMLAVRKRLKR